MSLLSRLEKTSYTISKALRGNGFPVEMFSGLLAFLWGGWLLVPGWDTFGPARPAYRVMASLAPEWAWGIFILCVGLLQLGGMACEHKMARTTGALLSMFVWAVVSITIFLSDPQSVGSVTYGVLTLMSVWIYSRLTIGDTHANRN